MGRVGTRNGAVAKSGLIGWGGAMAMALAVASPAMAQGLDPQIGQPLMQMMQAANMQCQQGNQQGCMLVPQLQQAANELMQAQMACQQGNPQACQMYQMGAQQVMMAYQQAFGGGMAGGGMAQNPGYSPQQQAWDHQQRMQQQQFQFQQQQQQYQQQQRQNDWNHQRFMDTLRR